MSSPPTTTTLSALAAHVGGVLRGEDHAISGVAGIREAQPGQVTFLANPRYTQALSRTRASGVVISPKHPTTGIARIEVDEPYYAFSRIVRWFHEQPYRSSGVHPQAAVASDAIVGADPSIGPFVSIGRRARIGDRVTLLAGAAVGDDVTIGDDTVVHPNVTIRDGSTIGRRVILHSGVVIGSDGFGFATRNGRHEKILQVGTVVIEDDVELGANVCVDRAALGATTVKRGTKVDNLVQIAHNVTVGEDCLLVAQAGISGSTELGRGVVLAGQVGVVGHVTLGDGAMVGAQSGVAADLDAGQVVSGSPAIAHAAWLRVQAALPTLPEMRRTIKRLEARVAELEQRLEGSKARSKTSSGSSGSTRSKGSSGSTRST